MSAIELRKAAAELREFWPGAPVEPEIAAALADWLDVESGYQWTTSAPRRDAALAVARLINGGAA